MPLAVRPVETSRDLGRFIDLPYQLHARDPNWVPPLRRDVKILLSRTRNPFFEHAEAEYFLAEREGRVVGRIAAIANRLHNETHGDKVGFFGFFEAIDDQAVANALFDRAAAWLGDRGFDTIRGPASFSVNDECGLLVDGFQYPNTIMMPHNPPYYRALHERAGFAIAKDLIAYQGGDEKQFVPPPERIVRAVDLASRRYGITVRSLRLDDFVEEVNRVKYLYNRCWENNWGAIPMTDHEIDHLAHAFRPVVNPDLVPFAERDGEPIGFGLTLPDFNQVLRTNRNGRMLPSALELLWKLKTKKIRRCRILLLGVLPDYRGKAVDAVLYHWIWIKARDHGMTWGEGGWVLEDNPAMNAGLTKLGMTPYKTYRLYDRPL
jgi:GNAT superfamily N-acetyltransferase